MSVARRLSLKQQKRLLEIAREAISSKLTRGSVPAFVETDAGLAEARGAFVSLHDAEDRLRGCIGSLYAEKALFETVAEMAGEAATADPRFHPMTAAELPRTAIEISALTPFRRIDPAEVEVGRHGLYVARGPRRGVLLPQVPGPYGWTREEFLAQTCKKAGLPADAWLDGQTLVMAFEAEVFSDLTVADALSDQGY